MIYLIIKVESGYPSVELLHGNRAEVEKRFIELFAEHCPVQANVTPASTLLNNRAFSYGCGIMHLLTVDTNDNPISRAMLEFIDCIDSTGGINEDDCPAVDPEWLDLGDVYMQACAAMGVEEKRA